MKIKKRIIVIAVILGLITVGILYYYLESLKVVSEVKVDLTEVVISINTIPAHVKVTSDMVAIKSLPSESVNPDAIKNLDEVLGFTTKTEIVNGEQIMKTRIASAESPQTLSYRIPENMRAMTISMNEVTGVGGYINKGDKIDILVSYTDPLINPTLMTITQFQNIEILELGGNNAVPVDGTTTGVPTSLTILITPSQAEVLAYAYQSGVIHLTLRNPVDNAINVLTAFRTEEFSAWRER